MEGRREEKKGKKERKGDRKERWKEGGRGERYCMMDGQNEGRKEGRKGRRTEERK